METNLMINGIFEDALFAAVAAIGFSSISHTPKRAYFVCALAAAAGHALRYFMTNSGIFEDNIIVACTVASLLVGVIAVAFSPVIKVPAEACLFPALLPMIPGMYAYRSIAALMKCISNTGEHEMMHSLYLLCYNGFTCIAIVMGMVIAGNLPIFLFKKHSFQATRQ